jgi:DUF4097 and DUF4098 domain-containing protein YvlB
VTQDPNIEFVSVTLENIEETSTRIQGSALAIDTRNFERNLGTFFGFATSLQQVVRIRIPTNAPAPVMEISTGSGNVSIEGIITDSITINTSSGNVRLSRTVTEHVNISTSSGTIRGTFVEMGNGSLNSNSGRISLDYPEWNSINIRTASGRLSISDALINDGTGESTFRTSSGSINISIDGSMSDFSYHGRSSSGSIHIDGQRGNRTISGGNGPHMITLESSSGSIRLEFN